MRKLLSVLALALVTASCAGDTTGPDGNAATLDDMAALAYGAMQVGSDGPGENLMARLGQLPPAVALTGEQIARIGGLIDAFVAATAADRDALAAILRSAAEARQAGKSAEEVRSILSGGAEIRVRLRQSESALRDAIMAVLTPAQRAALMNRPPREPRPCALTDEQRNEISGLLSAFEQANAADVATVRSALERARTARDAGASRQEVAAILGEARAAAERLAAARTALHAAIKGVFTPAQQAAGCSR